MKKPRYVVRPPSSLKSNFLVQLEAREAAEAAEEKAKVRRSGVSLRWLVKVRRSGVCLRLWVVKGKEEWFLWSR